jgi:hypothetical protein
VSSDPTARDDIAEAVRTPLAPCLFPCPSHGRSVDSNRDSVLVIIQNLPQPLQCGWVIALSITREGATLSPVSFGWRRLFAL